MYDGIDELNCMNRYLIFSLTTRKIEAAFCWGLLRVAFAVLFSTKRN